MPTWVFRVQGARIIMVVALVASVFLNQSLLHAQTTTAHAPGQTLAKQAWDAYNAKRYAEAEKHLRQLLADKTLPAGVKREVDLLLNDTLEKQGAPDKLLEAENRQLEALKVQEPAAKTPQDFSALSDAYARLGYTRTLQNNMAGAGDNFRVSLTYLVNALPQGNIAAIDAEKREKLERLLQNLNVIVYRLRADKHTTEAKALVQGIEQAYGDAEPLANKSILELYAQQGLILHEEHLFLQALESFDKAYAVARKLNDNDTTMWPTVLDGMGRSAYALGQYPKALSAYKELLSYNKLHAVLTPKQQAMVQSQIKELSSVDDRQDYLSLQGKDITRWNDKTKTITVYLPTAEENPLWKPELSTLLQNAFVEWQNAIHNRIQFVFTNSPKKYDVKIHWANRKDQSPVHTPNQTELGYNFTETWGEFIAKSDIFLYLDKGSETMSDLEFYKTSLHEIGHLLGIHVHSNHPDDVMFPTIHVNQERNSHLTPRDIATMNRLYETRASISNPEGYYLSEFEKFRKKQMADLECQDAPVITLNFDMPGAYGGQQHQLVCRRKQRPQDQIPVWLPNFNF